MVVAVLLLAKVGTRYHPFSDDALIELQIRDIGHHGVLLGPYSRFGWNHPGPLLFFVLLLPYRLTGSLSAGVNFGAALVNFASLAAAAWLAYRRGGLALMIAVLTALGAVMHWLGPQELGDPWNPIITVLPLALVVLLVWSAACGDRWALPAAAAVASFVLQAHVGYGPVIVLLLVWGAVMVARQGRSSVPVFVAAAGVIAVLWLPAVIEQLQPGPGNLGRLLHFSSTSKHTRGLNAGFRIVADNLKLNPSWLTAHTPSTGVDGDVPAAHGALAVPVLLLPFAVAIYAFRRRRSRDGWLLAATLVVALVGAFVGVSRIVGPIFIYLIRWVAVPAALAVAATLWAAMRSPRFGKAVFAAVAAAFVVVTVANTVAAARSGVPYATESRAGHDLAMQVLKHPLSKTDPVLVRSASSFDAGAFMPSLVLELERRGYPVRVQLLDKTRYGAHRVLKAGEKISGVLTVTSTEGGVECNKRRPGFSLVGRVTSHPLAQQIAMEDKLVALGKKHDKHEIGQHDYVEAVQKVGDPGHDIAVFSAGPDALPTPVDC
jgi:hypothetical protein